MRRVFEDRAWGREVGNRARASLEANFAYPHVARLLLHEFERLGVRF
jgi:hypothetical protein